MCGSARHTPHTRFIVSSSSNDSDTSMVKYSSTGIISERILRTSFTVSFVSESCIDLLSNDALAPVLRFYKPPLAVIVGLFVGSVDI